MVHVGFISVAFMFKGVATMTNLRPQTHLSVISAMTSSLGLRFEREGALTVYRIRGTRRSLGFGASGSQLMARFSKLAFCCKRSYVLAIASVQTFLSFVCLANKESAESSWFFKVSFWFCSVVILASCWMPFTACWAHFAASVVLVSCITSNWPCSS